VSQEAVYRDRPSKTAPKSETGLRIESRLILRSRASRYVYQLDHVCGSTALHTCNGMQTSDLLQDVLQIVEPIGDHRALRRNARTLECDKKAFNKRDNAFECILRCRQKEERTVRLNSEIVDIRRRICRVVSADLGNCGGQIGIDGQGRRYGRGQWPLDHYDAVKRGGECR
jgi:hypothetical protein